MHPTVSTALTNIRDEINHEYGFYQGTPRINYGPCGVFADIFFHQWNHMFSPPVHICFIMTLSRDECDHVCIRLPTGDLYDGGVGIHPRHLYGAQFVIDDMTIYDQARLEKWSYGLNRTYPRFCPTFNRTVVEEIVSSNLQKLLAELTGGTTLKD